MDNNLVGHYTRCQNQNCLAYLGPNIKKCKCGSTNLRALTDDEKASQKPTTVSVMDTTGRLVEAIACGIFH